MRLISHFFDVALLNSPFLCLWCISFMSQGLMLHKPVVLKLEEPRVTGKLAQPGPQQRGLQKYEETETMLRFRFYFVCHKTDKYLIIYTLLNLSCKMALPSLPALPPAFSLQLQEAAADTGEDALPSIT